MHAAGAALPEFKGIRDNSVAAPEGGKGYFSLGEFVFSSINFISNSFLPEMTELWCETQAPSWDSLGRVRKYFRDSARETLTAFP